MPLTGHTVMGNLDNTDKSADKPVLNRPLRGVANVMTLWTLFWESGALHAKSGDEERNKPSWPWSILACGNRSLFNGGGW
jgi:hypothetical protein